MSTEKEPDEDHEDEIRRRAIRGLVEAAIEVERDTGRREVGDEAKRSLILRSISIFAGAVISVLGVLMLALPGPGLLVLALGLGILAKDIPFAHKLLEKVRNRLPQDEEGHLTKTTIAGMILIALLGIILSAFSLWWSIWR